MQAEILKFDEFELDLGRYELRRRGQPLKLEKVPMELLILVAEREGQLVTREEIVQRLWGDDVFVDTRQGINTAVRKIRVALKDDPDNPRILQTVFGKGYRLVAPVTIAIDPTPSAPAPADPAAATLPMSTDRQSLPNQASSVRSSIKIEASPQIIPAAFTEESRAPSAQAATPPVTASAAARPGPIEPKLARRLFLVIQIGYLILYAAAFVLLPNIRHLGLSPSMPTLTLMAGAVGAAVRLYLISAVGFNYPGSGRLFRQAFPGILVLDALWAASPLFLYQSWGEPTLLFVAALAFLPFSQRTLILSAYGAGRRAPPTVG